LIITSDRNSNCFGKLGRFSRSGSTNRVLHFSRFPGRNERTFASEDSHHLSAVGVMPGFHELI
jgi:hypothetical protein